MDKKYLYAFFYRKNAFILAMLMEVIKSNVNI